MNVFCYKNLKEDCARKSDYGCDQPDYWEKEADNIFQRNGIARTVNILKVIYGGSENPVDEIYFDNGMMLYSEDYMGWKKEKNNAILKEYKFI